MDVIAKLRYLRISPKKVRLVLGLIRGQHVTIAEQQLVNLPKRSCLPILKLIKSAQANAEHNFKLDPKELFIKKAFADEGPKLKRFIPRAMGRATPVLKRMSHVTIVLAPISEKAKPPHMTPTPSAVTTRAKARPAPSRKSSDKKVGQPASNVIKKEHKK